MANSNWAVTPTVSNWILTLDNKAWHGVERVAEYSTLAARGLSIPIALGTFLRDTLETPGKCLEEIWRSGKSIRDWYKEQDPKHFFNRSNAVQIHTGHAVWYAMKTVAAPLIGVIDAICSFVKVFFNPLYTAKANASKQSLELFINENNLGSRRIVKFAQAARKTYLQTLLQQPHARFLETAQQRTRLEQLVTAKMQKFNGSRQAYAAARHIIREKANREALRAQWKIFKDRLNECNNANEVVNMLFIPDLN